MIANHCGRQSSVIMPVYDGEFYNDDRLFILDYGVADEEGNEVWCVVTRRNIRRFPPHRADKFVSEDEAVDFIKKIEPSTPRISLRGQGPSPVPSYEQYLQWLREQEIPSSLEIHETNQGPIVKVVLADVAEEEDGGAS